MKKRIHLSLDEDLLKWVDEQAKKHHRSRTSYIEIVLFTERQTDEG